MKDIFEFENQEYTLLEVEEAAKKKSLSIDDYIKKYNISRKPGKTNLTSPGADVKDPAAPDTDSKPEDGSSGRLEEIKKQLKFLEGDDGKIDPLDSPKRIQEYKNLVTEYNNIISQTTFDPDLKYTGIEPFEELEKGSEFQKEGGAKLRQSFGGGIQPLELEEVEVKSAKRKELRDFRIDALANLSGLPNVDIMPGDSKFNPAKFTVQSTAAIAATISDIIGGTTEAIGNGLLRPIINNIFNIDYDPREGGIDTSGFDEFSNLMRKYTLKKYDKNGNEIDIYTLAEQGKINEAAELAFMEGLGSAPYLALAIANPVWGSAVIGTSVAGNEFKKELKERPYQAINQIYIGSILKGGVEVASNWVAGSLQRQLLGLTTRGIKKETLKNFTDNYLTKVYKSLKSGAQGFAYEGGEEGFVSLSNDIIDSALYNDKFEMESTLRNMFNSIAVGGFLGGPTGLIGSAANRGNKQEAYKFIAPKLWRAEFNSIEKQIVDAKKNLETAPKRRKKFFQNKVEVLELQKQNRLKELTIKFDSLTKKEREKYAENIDIMDDAIAIINNPKYTKTEQDSAKLRMDRAANENQNLIGDIKFFNAGVESSVYRVLKSTETIEEAFKKAKRKAKNVKFKYISDVTQEFGAKIDYEREKGNVIGATITINKPVATLTEQTNVIGHELLHFMIAQKFATDNNSMRDLVDSFKSYLKETQPEIYKRIEQRIDENYRDENGNIKKGALEEYFNVFADLISKEKIIVNESEIDKIKNSSIRLLNSFGFGSVKLETGKDVFNFIRNYQKNIKNFKFKQLGIDLESSKLLEIPKKVQQTVNEEASKFSKSGASERVQEIYESQGAANALDIIDEFKPITNKIVNRYKDVPGFEFELLRDEIETGKRGILDMIMDYTPEKAKGAPLAAYINSLLPKRAIEAANRILDTEFKLDVTEAKSVTDTTTEETTEIQEQETSEELKSLRKKMGIGDEIIPIVFAAVQKTFGTKLPNIDEKTFKKELEKRYRTELKKPISKLFGKGEAYESFLRDNFETIYNSLPQSIFNKRLKEFAEPVLDEDGKQKREQTAEGNKIFTKKKISKAEFIKYFLGSDVGRSTQGTRKTAIVEAVAEAFAFDATMEVLSDPAILQKAEDIAELQGKKLPENFINKLSEIIDRPVDFKFSLDLSKSMGLKAKDAFSYTNFNDVNLGRIGYVDLAEKMIAAHGIQEFVNIIDPLVGRQYENKKNPKGISVAKGISVTEEEFKKYENVFFVRSRIPGKTAKKKGTEKEYETAQFLTLGRKDFYENILAKAINKKVVWTGKKGKKLIIDGKVIKRQTVPPQKPTSKGKKYPGFEDKKGWDATMPERVNFATDQRRGFKKIIDMLTLMYNNSDKTRNEVAKIGMILNSFNSSTDALVRTAAIPGLEMRVEGLKSNEYRYEHTQPASETLRQLGRLIVGDEKAQSFDEIMENFRVAIIPIKYDVIINKIKNVTRSDKKVLQSTSPLDSDGNLIKPSDPTKPTRYVAAEKAIAEAGLPPLILEDSLTKYSKSLSKEFNNLLQQTTGIPFYEKFSPVKATMMGRGKGKKFFIPYSADDFVGLLYATLGTKKQGGNEQMKWYEENLLRPFSRGIQQYETAKQVALRNWQALKKEAKKDVPGGLNKVNETGFTNQNSLRIYMWRKQGIKDKDIPGISSQELRDNSRIVRNDPKLKAFAERLMALNPEGYPSPSTEWIAGDITTDLVSYINDVKRAEYLTQWKENVDQIFNDQNKNKLKALYGESYIKALENMLYRMEKGRNKFKDASDIERKFQSWVNNSVGSIMFFNARSAVLQTLSAVNFINFSDNNPIAAGIALANFPQYVKDFSTLFNSDFLKQRRSGLQTDVNADEIAKAAATSKNQVQAMLAAILKFGFTPTQIADSFAIASGGATFYRNRINKYKKEGLSQKEAEQKAFTDFQEIAEETQQSARPDRISMQQAGSLGRLVLAFGNTPMQYARLTKKATLDLINGRGDWKTNISKIAYYSVIQNIIFSALQQALFALLFDEEEEDDKKARYYRIGNSSVDTLLRGMGVYGAAAATVKNMIIKIVEESKKSRPDYTKVAIEATAISPPINSKLRKLVSAGKTFTYKQSREKVFTEGFSLDNPAFLAAGKVISAGTNLPADRIVLKMDHIYTAMQPETELWQGTALMLGWGEWELGMIEKQTKKESNLKIKPFKKKSLKIKKFKN